MPCRARSASASGGAGSRSATSVPIASNSTARTPAGGAAAPGAPTPPSATSRTAREEQQAGRRAGERRQTQPRCRGQARSRPHEQREQDGHEPGQGHQRLVADGIGKGHRQRRQHVGAVGERQRAQHADRRHDGAEQERPVDEVVLGGDERVAVSGGEVLVRRLPGQQLAQAVERGDGPQPQRVQRAGELPAPHCLRVERLERGAAADRQVAHVGGQPERHQPERPRVAAHAVARRQRPQAPPARGRRGPVGRPVGARAVQVQQHDRHGEHDAGAARGAGEAGERAGDGKAPAPGRPEHADRQHEVQRLAVHGRQEQGHREERDQQDGPAGGFTRGRGRCAEPASLVEILQRGEPVQAIERDRQGHRPR